MDIKRPIGKTENNFDVLNIDIVDGGTVFARRSVYARARARLLASYRPSLPARHGKKKHARSQPQCLKPPIMNKKHKTKPKCRCRHIL